ncbi:DUF1624 domain-containing protein [Sphingosinicella sp. BN140058]|uniref:DUF1624 domain-containing protein n=1 Tax=Sphingosinicella sp. BN140058 TaxID=1892855 RepID=UPI001FB0C4BC|nr:heparan-alpha-glucosaminide N-acetyltransferase domain-containing protein [Sphingosinicella sp. BN140058]
MSRIQSIDALRGTVMLLMLVDHAREFFYIHAQVSDPMEVETIDPLLFFTRIAAHLCAPVFVALTGVAAWLYGQRHGRAAASGFLLKRGLFLIVLELTVVNFAWTFAMPPQTLFLQVIWAIGLSMIALSALIRLPAKLLPAIGLVLLFGHNLLDPISFAPHQSGHAAWAILHDRGYLDLTDTLRARTSYPVLPWIGVIVLGWSAGPWFSRGARQEERIRRLAAIGISALAIFLLLRATNVYGDPAPWLDGGSPLRTMMSFVNLTKYPPSADFLLLTLGVGALLLAALERAPARLVAALAVFGSAPLFFYVVHLYALHLLNLAAILVVGPNQGIAFSVPNVGALWLLAAGVAVPLWFACRWFVGVKRQSRNPLLTYL